MAPRLHSGLDMKGETPRSHDGKEARTLEDYDLRKIVHMQISQSKEEL